MMSLRERRINVDLSKKRENIHNEIIEDYHKHGNFKVIRAEQRNIMLVGRTRTGKSTIKSLLIDPTVIPDDLTLKSGTREPVFESFYVNDNQMVLNIIDTPGLFEHTNTEVDIRDNEVILRTIELCANREITKFHVVCFCVAITTGINKEDIESLKILSRFLGEEISRNSCLIVTRCESKSDKQRETMRLELKEDVYFKELADFFQLGIFFSGSLNPDDYNQANDNLQDQYVTISDYRSALIELFTREIEPYPVNEMIISDIRRTRDKASALQNQFESIQGKAKQLEATVEQLKASKNKDQHEIAELINKIRNLGNTCEAHTEAPQQNRCVIS